MSFIKRFRYGIHTAQLTSQLVISILVLVLANYVVYSVGKATPSFNLGIVIMFFIIAIVSVSEILFSLYDAYKGN